MAEVQKDEENETTCQICLDLMPTNNILKSICSSKCSAMICRTCFEEHIRVSISNAFPGILPKIRCPICLVLINKSRWENFIQDMQLECLYMELSHKACTFRSPCCHNSEYSHLPRRYTEYEESKLPELRLFPSQKRHIPELRTFVRKFGAHRVNARDVMNQMEIWFGEKKWHDVFPHVLPRILDDERRATLLLAYHAKFVNTKTHCCGETVCFNCKRNVVHEDPTHCDEENGFNEDFCMIECRNCRVTLVKVEGCDDVRCLCGFSMVWSDELNISNLRKRKLLPIDTFDLELYDSFKKWHNRLLESFVAEMPELQLVMQIRKFNAQHPDIKRQLRVFLSRYIWRRRWDKALTLDVRVGWIKSMCRKHGKILKNCISQWIWRRRLHKFNTQLPSQLRLGFLQFKTRQFQMDEYNIFKRFFHLVRPCLYRLRYEEMNEHIRIVNTLFETPEDY